MSSSLNRAQVIGNLTRDPEVRQTSGGQTIATFSVATNRKWKNQTTGQLQEEVEFHNVVAWGRLAEICGQYLKKGAKVYMDGRLKTRTWQDETGAKHYRTEIIAENLVMLDRKSENAEAHAAIASSAHSAEQTEENTPPPPSAEEIKVEDLPF